MNRQQRRARPRPLRVVDAPTPAMRQIVHAVQPALLERFEVCAQVGLPIEAISFFVFQYDDLTQRCLPLDVAPPEAMTRIVPTPHGRALVATIPRDVYRTAIGEHPYFAPAARIHRAGVAGNDLLICAYADRQIYAGLLNKDLGIRLVVHGLSETHQSLLDSFLDAIVPRLRQIVAVDALELGVPPGAVAYYCGAMRDQDSQVAMTTTDALERSGQDLATFCDTYTLERMRQRLGSEFPETHEALESAVPAGHFRIFVQFVGTICIHDVPIIDPNTARGTA